MFNVLFWPLLAASRMNPVFVNLVLPLAVGLFAAGVTVVAYYFGAKKRGQSFTGAILQKTLVAGVCSLVVG